ncbi:MAG: hypothetical protein HY701_06330, partial [Gemmatimonadetes bacterium]|nr:hypothetical protein [Gemmatimonadota bacterium]
MTRKLSTSLPVRLALGAAMATLGVWACEGENAFAPRLVGPPQIIALTAPAEVRAGQSIDVRVIAVGEARIDSVAVRFRRAFETSVGRVVSPPSQTATVDLSAQVPTQIADTLLIVTAVVRDVTGNLSATKADTVRVIDTTAPTVSITLVRSPVGLGKPDSFTVAATDNVALRSLGYVLT